MPDEDDSRARHLERRGGNLRFAQAVLNEVALGGHSAVLEIGCGTGVLAEYIGAAAGIEVVGTELSPEMAEIARRRIRCFHSPDGRPPEGVGPFDLIYCKDVLPEVGDKRSFFQFVRSSLRAGGVFCTYLPTDSDLAGKPLFRLIPCGLVASRASYGSLADVVGTLTQCGFADVRTSRLLLGMVPLDESYVRRHWDGYFSNSEAGALDEERTAGLQSLREVINALADFGILAHYEWERTMVTAR